MSLSVVCRTAPAIFRGLSLSLSRSPSRLKRALSRFALAPSRAIQHGTALSAVWASPSLGASRAAPPLSLRLRYRQAVNTKVSYATPGNANARGEQPKKSSCLEKRRNCFFTRPERPKNVQTPGYHASTWKQVSVQGSGRWVGWGGFRVGEGERVQGKRLGVPLMLIDRFFS